MENVNWDFLKLKSKTQLKKERNLATLQLSTIGEKYGMKITEVEQYPENIKRSYNHLLERIKQIDNII